MYTRLPARGVHMQAYPKLLKHGVPAILETASARLEYMQKNSPIATDCCTEVPLVKPLR